jgi:hypothetical protein
MIKMKNEDLERVLIGLQALFTKEMPITASARIIKFLKKISGEFEDFEKLRMMLLVKYGAKDENDKLIVKDGKYELIDEAKFNDDILELAKIEIELQDEMMELSDFGGIAIKPIDLSSLLGIIIKE